MIGQTQIVAKPHDDGKRRFIHRLSGFVEAGRWLTLLTSKIKKERHGAPFS
jgi:hypothetical protein